MGGGHNGHLLNRKNCYKLFPSKHKLTVSNLLKKHLLLLFMSIKFKYLLVFFFNHQMVNDSNIHLKHFCQIDSTYLGMPLEI